MTVKELKEKLDEMHDNAEVLVVDSVLSAERITAVKYRESTIHSDGVVQICIYE